MSNDKPTTPPAPALSHADDKIKAIEEKLAQPTEKAKEENKTTSPSILGEPQSIDDYISAMLGIKKK